MRAILMAAVCSLAAGCAQPVTGHPSVEIARQLGGNAELGTRNLARVNTGLGPVNVSIFSRTQREYERAWIQNSAQEQQRGRPTPSGRI